MNKTAIALGCCLAGIAITGGIVLSANTPEGHEVPVGTSNGPVEGDTIYLLTPCEQEDSDNCYWDAEVQGNGQGRSFVVIDGTYYYGEVGQ